MAESPSTVEHTGSWGRRVVALVVDWLACSLVALAVLGSDAYGGSAWGWVVMGIFWLEVTVGTALVGASFGQLGLGIRVLTWDRRPVPLFLAAVRTLLICLVIPPLVFKPDGRGLHDLAVGSAAYDLKALRASGLGGSGR